MTGAVTSRDSACPAHPGLHGWCSVATEQGWVTFGTHAIFFAQLPILEFSTMTDSDGDPLWERSV